MSASILHISSKIVVSTDPSWVTIMDGVYIYAEHCAAHKVLSSFRTMQEGMRLLLVEFVYAKLYGQRRSSCPIDYKWENAQSIVWSLKDYAMYNPRKES